MVAVLKDKKGFMKTIHVAQPFPFIHVPLTVSIMARDFLVDDVNDLMKIVTDKVTFRRIEEISPGIFLYTEI